MEQFNKLKALRVTNAEKLLAKHQASAAALEKSTSPSKKRKASQILCERERREEKRREEEVHSKELLPTSHDLWHSGGHKT